MDAISDDDPTDFKPPTDEQQKAFDEFQFNTNIKQEWTDYYSDINERKDKDKYMQTLWDKPVDTNAFKKPKSELPIDFDTVHIEIKRSMSTQINNMKHLIDPKEAPQSPDSIKNVPDSMIQENSKLGADISVNNAIAFEVGPVKSTSSIYKIAVCKDDIDAVEQEEKISEVTVIMTEEFVNINKELIPV